MKKLVKILIIVMWIALVGGFCTLLGFTNIEQNDSKCKDYVINIDYGKADVLVTRDDIYELVAKTGNPLKGQYNGTIDVEKVERAIKHQPYVADANVYMSLEGMVTIEVTQRQPILRIYNQKNESFYLDGLGYLLPLNPAFSARVLVANGYIPESLFTNLCYLRDSVSLRDSLEFRSVMNNLYKLASFITKDRFLKAQIQQIYVEENGELELVPRVGNHTILLGTPEDLEEKFDRLFIFYKLGLSQTGWQRYNVINIKFKNQVVCSKI